MPANRAEPEPDADTPQPASRTSDKKDHTVAHIDPAMQRIWDYAATSPLHSLWDFQGTPPLVIVRRTFHAVIEDNLVSRAAELGYYFLFALFPTLVSASAILGLVARSANDIYARLLHYMALVVPREALTMVLDTFNQTTASATSGKITFGLVAAIWSASVGFSAIQDGMNAVYKTRETRSYLKARLSAILVTVGLSIIITTILTCLLAGTFSARLLHAHIADHRLAWALTVMSHSLVAVVTAALLTLLFAVIYYFAPDLKQKKWRWLTPGAAIGIACWFLASLALRLYLHYFNSYSVTYGSLGAVIILLTWFYITGLTLLLGAEVNSEIEAAAAECRLKAAGAIPESASADPRAPIESSPAA